MSVFVRDVMEAMENWAPRSLAYEWDNVGLQIGDPDEPVSRVLVCLSVTEAVLETALCECATMVVAHHPVIFKPLKTLRADRLQENLIMELVCADIACYVAHTNLDLAPRGVSHALADAVGLSRTGPLFPVEHAAKYKLVCFVPESHLAALRSALSEAGAGVIGDYTECSFSTPGVGTFKPGSEADPFSGEIGKLNEEPERRFETIVPQARLHAVFAALYDTHPYDEPAYDVIPLVGTDQEIALGVRGVLEKSRPLKTYAEEVRRKLEVESLRIYGNPGAPIHNVAVLGGSGGCEINRIPEHVDLYITGDVKYHDAQDALQRGLCVIDAGHRGTELPILPRIQAYLSETTGVEAFVHRETEAFTTIVG